MTPRPNRDDTAPSPGPTEAEQKWTEEKIRDLGVIIDLPTAGRIFGIGREQAYLLARAGEFPAPVIHLGNRVKVPVAGILAALGLTSATDLTSPAKPRVDHPDAIRWVDDPDQPHQQGEP